MPRDNNVPWHEVSAYITKYRTDEQGLYAPKRLADFLDSTIDCYESMSLNQRYRWIVVHKGELDKINSWVLKKIAERDIFIPLLANEVFVLFGDKLMGLEELKDDHHIKSLWNALNRLNLEELQFDLIEKKIIRQIAILQNSINYIQQQQFNKNNILTIQNIRDYPLSEITKISTFHANSTFIGGDTITGRVLSRYIMYLNSKDVSLTPHLSMSGYWEIGNTQLIARLINEGGYCVDAGANCGYFALLMVDIVGKTGKVAAVEANPNLCALIEKSANVNGYKNRLSVVNKALGSMVGKSVQLVIDQENLGSASLYHSKAENNFSVEVETTTIDELTKGWPRVDFVKIDIEAAEYETWKGMKKTLKNNKHIVILMEVSMERNYDCMNFLEEIKLEGFKLMHVNSEGNMEPVALENPSNFPSYWDLILIR